MRKLISVFMLTLTILCLVRCHASASDTIPLRFTAQPTSFPDVVLLPDGSYEVIYYVQNTAEYWLNQGRNDVSNCVIEVFDASGQSVWRFPVLGIDIFSDDTDAFFYQNAVYRDQIVFETYWGHSYERYVSQNWLFNGERLYTSFDSIHQAETDFRYIISQYPYTLEMWSFREKHNTSAKLTYVIDGSSVDLPYAYGNRTTCVDAKEHYHMLYEADDEGEGEHGTVYLLSYAPDIHTFTWYKTNLTTCSGHIIVNNDEIIFMQEGLHTYTLYTAECSGIEQEPVIFTPAGKIPLASNEMIENIIPAGNHLLCLKSKVIDLNTVTEHVESELCAVSPECKLVSVRVLNGEAAYLGNTTGSLQFVCKDGAGGYQIIRLSDEDVSYFFTYFDQAQ